MIKKIVLDNKDKKDLKSINISGKCIKVKVFYDGYGRHTSAVELKTIKLYLNDNNKIYKTTLVVNKYYELKNLKVRNIKKSIVNKQYSFQCLSHSKYILTGSSKILKSL